MYGTSMPMGMYGMNMNSSMYQGNYGLSSEQGQGKGKGKLKEADFEAAFAQAAASFAPAHTETPRIVEIDDSVTDVEHALADAQVGERSEFTERVNFLNAYRHIILFVCIKSLGSTSKFRHPATTRGFDEMGG
jgi:hypothetical protein